MSQDNKDVAVIKSLAEQLNNIKNKNDMKSFVKFKDDYSVISQALNSDEFKIKNFSHIIYVLSSLKELNTKITIDQTLCNKLFNNGKMVLYDQISLSDLKLICDFCKDEAISNEVAKKLFGAGVNLNNEKFFDEVSISEFDSMKKKFSIEAQEVVKNTLNNNRKKLLDKLDSKKPEAYDKRFSKFVFKLYCFQICFCGSLDLGDTEEFIKLIPDDIINIFVLTTYFENDIDNKNASPKKDDFSVEDKKMLEQLFLQPMLELATKILITHKSKKSKLNLDELKIIILVRYGFNNDEDFKNKIKDLSENEIDDNFWLNNFKSIISKSSTSNEINHICYLLWLATFLSKSNNQQNELKFSPNFTYPSDTFQLFKFFLEKQYHFKHNYIYNILKKAGPDDKKLLKYKFEDNSSQCIKSVKANFNKKVEPEIINEINFNQSQKRYISFLTHQRSKEEDLILFVFENNILVEIEYHVKKKDKNEEYNKRSRFDNVNNSNITEFDNRINHKKLKIIFVILGAVSIISVAFLFINIFYFELAVFHFLNILLISLFVLSVFCIVILSIAIKNINTPPESFRLRGLFDYLILSKSEKTKSLDQNLNMDSQMENQGQIKS